MTRLGIQNHSLGLLSGHGDLDSLSGLVLEFLLKVLLIHVGDELSPQEGQLHGGVGGVAGEQEDVSWLDHGSKPHEHARVGEQSQRHSLRDLIGRLVVVQHCCTNETPVGGGAPEVNGPWTNW